MSNADYSVTGSGSFCTIAVLSAGVTHLATTLPIAGLKSVGPGDRYIGMAILVDDEIMRLESIGSSSITVARGCADTLPAEHSTGAEVWFFDNTLSSDGVDYLASATVGVKILPATTSATMPIAYSPPEAVTFNSRFIRPYPPADLKVDGQPWFTSGITLNAANPTLSFTWAHRNRVVQWDALVSHTEASVTPEVDATYTIKIRRADNNAVLRTVTGLTVSAWNYTQTMFTEDVTGLGLTEPVPVYAEIFAVRDGYESLQRYNAPFTGVSEVAVAPYGWEGAYTANATERSISNSDSVVVFSNVSILSGHFGDRTKVAISGKVYAEFELLSNSNDSAWHAIGLIIDSATVASQSNSGSYAMTSRSPNTNTGCGIAFLHGYRTDGNNNDDATYAWGVGDRIGIAVDTATGKVWYRKNGTWLSGDPGAGTSPTHTLSAGTYRFAWMNYVCNGSSPLTTGMRIYASAALQTGSMPSGFSAYAA